MEIFIKQNMFSFFGRKYIVYANGEKRYSIRRLWLTPLPKYKIKDSRTNTVIGTIQNKFLYFRAHAKIILNSGNYAFEQKSLGSKKYSCKQLEGAMDQYEIKGHEGFECSIFKNENQIGNWTKNQLVIFDKDIYEIHLDYDAQIPLIAAMVVLVDTYSMSVTIGGDIGWNISLGKKQSKKKSGWKPKVKSDQH
jgi:uncharacterized protein YxjI